MRFSPIFTLFLVVLGSRNLAAQERPQPLIVAHRGLLQHAPENTLSNFRACLELRLGFEFDVQKTRDGHLVCIHDDTVTRTTNGKGRVEELTLDQIRRLDAGGWFDARFAGEKIPTIEEVLKLVSDYRHHEVLVAVDLKAAGVEQDVVRLGEKYQVLHRLLFIGRTITEPTVREQIKKASPQARTSTLANTPDDLPRALAAPHSDWVYFRYIPNPKEREAVRAAKKQTFLAGLLVSGHVPQNWKHAAEAGINGILTDYPLELRTVLKSLPRTGTSAIGAPGRAP